MQVRPKGSKGREVIRIEDVEEQRDHVKMSVVTS